MSTPPLVKIKAKAVAQMIHFDKTHPGKETAGLLIGHLDEGVLYVDEIEVGEQEGTSVHVTMSDQALVNAVMKVSNRTDNKTIVGWWHTHPGLTSFMSGTDINTQSNYQNLFPEAIAIVIDPLKYQETLTLNNLDFGVYVVRNNSALKIHYEVIDGLEFGLAVYLKSKFPELEIQELSKPLFYAPKITREKVELIRNDLNAHKANLSTEDFGALNRWLDLVEEVDGANPKPSSVDTSGLFRDLDRSIRRIENHLNKLSSKKYDKQDLLTFLFATFIAGVGGITLAIIFRYL